MEKKHGPSLFTKQIILGTSLVFAAILFFVLLNNFTSVSKVIGNIWALFSPFVSAFIIAYLLNRPIMFFERRVFTRFRNRKGLSIATVYLLALLIIASLLSVVIPQVASSLSAFMPKVTSYLQNLDKKLPEYIEQFHLSPDITTWLFDAWENMFSGLNDMLQKHLPKLLDYSFAAGKGLLNIFMAVIASMYMLLSKASLLRGCRRILGALLPAAKAQRVLDVTRHANRIFSDFIVGKIMDSVIIGLLCFIGMLLIHRPYAVLISLIVGVTNIIPFFGPFIGAIPSVLILLIADPLAALIFLVFILVLQQFDGNILGPRILGDSTGLSPLWVLISITVAGGLFGFIGMVFGVPSCAVLYSLCSEGIQHRLDKKHFSDDCIEFLPPDEKNCAAASKKSEDSPS